MGATDNIETTNLDSRKVEYLYSDNEGHWLMDLENYEQNAIPAEVFGDDIKFLKPNTPLTAMYHDGKLISYELAEDGRSESDRHVSPQVKGATATNQQKDATMETGLQTRVPPFIEIGELIRISDGYRRVYVAGLSISDCRHPERSEGR